MEDKQIVGVLEISDEVLEKEFLATNPVNLDIYAIKSTVPVPISVGTYNSSFQACCCTILNNSEVCGGNGYLPSSIECLPGGA